MTTHPRKGNCAWCTGSLEGLEYVYTVKSTKLDFCTIQCSTEYKDYQLSNTKSRWYLALAGALALFMLAYATTPRALAHEHEGVNYGDFKDSRGYSCCNDSDCRPTVAYQNDDGTWTALADGRKVLVPLDKILKMKSPDGRSHICISPDALFPYCFVPGEVRS